jgi:pimeloyl-ACP methyl ester carboxylesterase
VTEFSREDPGVTNGLAPTKAFDAGLSRRAAVLSVGGALAASSAAQALVPEPKGPWTSEGFVKRSGGQVHYACLGEGEPIVLLSKLGGSTADWRKVAPLLAARGRKVIAVDVPGQGRSTMLGTPPFIQTIPESAAMIKAALDEIGVTRFAIAGNSLGGIVGVVMSAFWPKSVSKLALVSVSLIPAYTREGLAQLDKDARGQFGPNWEPLPRPPADLAIVGVKDPAVQREDDESRARTGIWLRPAERGVALVGVTDYLPRVEAPTLVLISDQGRYARYGKVAQGLMKDVKVVVVPGAGSFIHMEQPQIAGDAINAFLDA